VGPTEGSGTFLSQCQWNDDSWSSTCRQPQARLPPRNAKFYNIDASDIAMRLALAPTNSVLQRPSSSWQHHPMDTAITA
jgi:Pyruvate/2-oxoacid:ferredoxin oxidoreductase gamma subunit